jgi:hypothetical protein
MSSTLTPPPPPTPSSAIPETKEEWGLAETLFNNVWKGK